MKRWLSSVAVFGILIMLAPAVRSEVYMDYDFSGGLVWQVGGFEVYDIMVRGEVAGQARVDYGQLTMLDQPAIRLTWNESWTDAQGVSASTDVDTKMLASDLTALLTSRKDTVGDDEWIYEGNFAGEDLTIGYYLPGEAERQEYVVNRPGRILDASILPLILRNIPFENNNFVTLTVLDTTTQKFFTPIIKINGSELVQTSSTQYDCWTVSVSTNRGGFTAWYTKTEKHYLIRIRYSDREIVLNHHS
jgi:hypothetical protein